MLVVKEREMQGPPQLLTAKGAIVQIDQAQAPSAAPELDLQRHGHLVHAGVHEAGQLVSKAHQDLLRIERRGFFRRLVANNTRDLAATMRLLVLIQQRTTYLIWRLHDVELQTLSILHQYRKQLDASSEEMVVVAEAMQRLRDDALALRRDFGDVLDHVDAQLCAGASSSSTVAEPAPLELPAASDQPAARHRAVMAIAVASLVVAVLALGLAVFR